MLQINRSKFKLLSQGKVFKCHDYGMYLEAERAVAEAYQENDRLIQYASELCEKLVSDTNGQVSQFVTEANENVASLIAQANQNAETIIQQANQKSQTLLAETEKKRQEILAEAKKYYAQEAKRGYKDGFDQGKETLAKQLAEASIKNSANIKQLENNIVGLVLKALKRILGEVDQETLMVSLARQALKAVKNQSEAILKVSPRDAGIVRSQMEKVMADGIVDYLEVVADSRLQPGTCILETDIGVVDASLEVQMNAITEAFKKAEKSLLVSSSEPPAPELQAKTKEATATEDKVEEIDADNENEEA
ncbi:MAG: HrpE/YscL family type III secretion apparatus protein [Verrucomicrobiota bacterium]|nr:MAG: HrpE/YscL family type III secretion apparatus protein [Verrucomicrobiota bacterium]